MKGNKMNRKAEFVFVGNYIFKSEPKKVANLYRFENNLFLEGGGLKSIW